MLVAHLSQSKVPYLGSTCTPTYWIDDDSSLERKTTFIIPYPDMILLIKDASCSVFCTDSLDTFLAASTYEMFSQQPWSED